MRRNDPDRPGPDDRAARAERHCGTGATFEYLTYDQVEAMTIGERIAVGDGASVAQWAEEPCVSTFSRAVGTLGRGSGCDPSRHWAGEQRRRDLDSTTSTGRERRGSSMTPTPEASVAPAARTAAAVEAAGTRIDMDDVAKRHQVGDVTVTALVAVFDLLDSFYVTLDRIDSELAGSALNRLEISLDEVAAIDSPQVQRVVGDGAAAGSEPFLRLSRDRTRTRHALRHDDIGPPAFE